MNSKVAFKIINKKTFNKNCCFLCGSNKKITKEHVFPKWIQNKFDLWNERLILLNRHSYKYKNFTIPCCDNCNKSLGKIEKKVQRGIEKGFKSALSIDKNDLFFWLGKIFYGVIYKELFIKKNLDQRKKSVNIISKKVIREFQSHQMFLLGALNKHKFVNFFPASIYIFKTQKPKDVKYQWDYLDDINSLFISLRIGGVGLVAVLQDGESQKLLNDSILTNFYKIDLHPIQFQEVSAIICARANLFNRTPKFISMENNGVLSTMMPPIQGMSNKSVYNQWDMHLYAKILSSFTHQKIEDIYDGDNKVMTWTNKINGKINFMDAKNIHQNNM